MWSVPASAFSPPTRWPASRRCAPASSSRRVFAVCFVGAFQGSRSYGDLVVLVVFGLLGWTMKQYGWARAPLILGFVLGKLIEKYLFISVGRYQFEWLERPGVIAIFVLTALVLARPIVAALYGFVRRSGTPAAAALSAAAAPARPSFRGPERKMAASRAVAASATSAPPGCQSPAFSVRGYG